MSEKRQRSEVVSVRFTAEEAAKLMVLAAEQGQTISSYIRGRAMGASLLARPGARLLCRANGAEIVFWSSAPDWVAVS
jgi:hypothetical protein